MRVSIYIYKSYIKVVIKMNYVNIINSNADNKIIPIVHFDFTIQYNYINKILLNS